VLGQRSVALRDSSGLPIHVYALDGKDCYQAFCARYEGRRIESVGFFQPGADTRILTFNANLHGLELQVAQHECVHALLFARNYGLPLTMHEGLADFFGTFVPRADRALYGLTIPVYLYQLDHSQPIGLDAMFAMQMGSEYAHGASRGTFYAESWALVHYLMVRGPGGRALDTFLARLKRGDAPRTAFEGAFPAFPWAGMPKVLHDYGGLDWTDWNQIELPLGHTIETAPVRSRELEPREIRTRLGEQLLWQGEDRAREAEACFAAALALDSTYAPALAGRAYIAAQEHRRAEAARLSSSAFASPSADAGSDALLGRAQLLLAGQDTLRAGTPEDTLGAFVLAARAAFRRSLERAPGNASVQEGLASTYRGEPEFEAEALAALERARRGLDDRPEVLATGAYVLARAGQRARGKELLALASARHDTSDTRAVLEAWTDGEAGRVRADVLARRSTAAEGVQALEALAADIADPVARARARRARDGIAALR
jgi:hypothetical protein